MMVERICPQCQRGNPLENRFCGQCGNSLDRDELAPRQSNDIVIAGHTIPAQLKQVGTAMAVSLATLAAEASLAWLRQRIEHIRMSPGPTSQQQPTSHVRQVAPISRAESEFVPINPNPSNNVVTILSQRVVEIRDRDGIARQTVERSVWQREG
jgi:negative regulator of sigma E activity